MNLDEFFKIDWEIIGMDRYGKTIELSDVNDYKTKVEIDFGGLLILAQKLHLQYNDSDVNMIFKEK